MKIKNNTKGSATLFFTVGVLPVFTILAMISVGLADYYFSMQHEQKLLDQAAMLGATALPDTNLAYSKVSGFLKQKSKLFKILQTEIQNDLVSIKINAEHNFKFAQIFQEKFNLPMVLKSQARSRKQNFLILIDSSYYMAPDPFYGKTWGNPGDWPEAQYLNNNFTENNYQLIAKNPHLLTQQCFNPVFSLVKYAALEFDTYAKTTNDYISLNFLPLESEEKDFCAQLARFENYSEQYRFPLAIMNTQETIWAQPVSSTGRFMDFSYASKVLLGNIGSILKKENNNKIIILGGDLPRHNFETFPAEDVKNTINQFFNNLTKIGTALKSQVQFYYFIFPGPDNQERIDSQLSEFKDFFNQFSVEKKLKIKIFIITEQDILAQTIKEVMLDEQTILLAK